MDLVLLSKMLEELLNYHLFTNNKYKRIVLNFNYLTLLL